MQALHVWHKGSNVTAGTGVLGSIVLRVDGEYIARAFAKKGRDHKLPVIEADAQCAAGYADLAIYIKTMAFRREWILMDGETVIAANYPLALPRSRRPESQRPEAS